jgi:DNA repair protein SbcC/Rad50
MILNSITLHNFMSYADATLDLEAIPVACLAGANGSGKSALLDATTWAIWEQARASSDDLIRLGQKEMWVDLRFKHEGQAYRIRRSRQRTLSRGNGKGTSKGTLELQVATDEVISTVAAVGSLAQVATLAPATRGRGNDGHKTTTMEGPQNLSVSFEPENPGGVAWRSLTGANMRDTQRLICELLRMDYETFVNSAYLKQGRADEFANKQATERKQILGEILGLSYYDRLQEKCRDHLRNLKHQKDLIEQMLLRLPEANQELLTIGEELNEVTINLERAEAEKTQVEAQVNELTERHLNLNVLEERASSVRAQCQELERETPALAQQVAENAARLAALDALIQSQTEIEADAAQYESLRTQSEMLDQHALKDQSLRSQKLERRSALADLRNKLEITFSNARENFEREEKRKEELLKATAQREKIASAYEDYKIAAQKESEYAKKQDDYSRLLQRSNEIQSTVDEIRIRLEAEIEQKQKTKAELESLLRGKDSLEAQRQSIEGETSELEKMESEFERVEQKGQTLRTTQERLKAQIQNLKRIEVEYQAKIDELNACSDSTVCPLCAGPIVDRAAVIKRYRKLIADSHSEIHGTESKIEEVEKELVDLRKQYLKIKERLASRKELDKQIGQFRERLASVQRAQDSHAEVNSALEQLEKRLQVGDYAQVERESLIAVKEQIVRLDFDPALYSNLQAQIRTQRSIETRYHQLQKEVAELEKLEKETPALKEEMARQHAVLTEESYGKELRIDIEKLEGELSLLKYESGVHSETKQKLSALLPRSERFKDLQRALSERPALSQTLAQSNKLLESKKELSSNLQQELAKLQKELQDLPDLGSELSSLKSAMQSSQIVVSEYAKQAAIRGSRKDHLQAEVANLELKKKDRDQTKLSIDDYAFLVEAFGKKGIQAIIIENAIPEIETDANRILSRLTNSRMHVALMTQQKNKSGNVVETLDIVIADEVGTRNYELYSGGEAFKVNFAVRVALSRLLARRAGAKLETLIIDEGFGSQDDVSRERLVKAIRSVQEDFARILVITHFSDVKEMFPTHILVSKNNGTSSIQLLN